MLLLVENKLSDEMEHYMNIRGFDPLLSYNDVQNIETLRCSFSLSSSCFINDLIHNMFN